MQQSQPPDKKPHNNEPHASDLSRWFVLVLVLPLLLALGMAMGLGGGSQAPEDAPVDVAAKAADESSGRLIVLIVDSLRPQSIADDQLMPALHRFSRRSDTIYLPLNTCKANFSLPCIQTMLEGRQSPFVAGLHNFTGQAGSQASLPGTLDAAGYELAMISDHTLDSLYAEHARVSIDVQQWPGTNHLERDLMAIERARELLDEGTDDVLLLHTIGTDKTAHKDQPDSERYREHYATVDEALGEFLATIDLERDNLLIVGDHGHDELGHHTPESVAIFAGHDYQEMFDQLPEVDGIRQTDLLYFMSYPLLLPVPLTYEGEVYAVDDPQGRLARFLEIQKQSLTAAGVSESLDVREGMAQVREAQRDERFDPIYKYAPLLLLFGLFLAHALSALRRGSTSSNHEQVMYALVAAAVPVGLLTNAEWGLWLCVPILVGAGFAIWRPKSGKQESGGQESGRKQALRDHLFVALLVAGCAFTGLYAADWAHYFHTTGGFKPSIVVFYAALFGAGAALAVQFFGSLRHFGYGTMAAALFILPSGLYYYQTAQNVLLGAFIGAAAVGLWWLGTHAQKAKRLLEDLNAPLVLSALVTALTAFFVVWQEAGGWEWHLYAVIWMRRFGDIATFGIMALIFAYWMWAARSWTSRAVILVLGVGLAVICVGLGELPAEKLVGSLLPSLFVVGLLDLERRVGLLDGDLLETERTRDTQLRRGLLIASLVIISLWIATSGFLLQNIDFSFALDWFSTYFDQERDVFFFTFLATLLKYGLPPAAVIIALRTVGKREDFRLVMWGASAFLGLKVFLLLVQIFAGSTVQSEKYHELMISELLFVYPLAIVLPVLYVAIALIDRLAGKLLRS